MVIPGPEVEQEPGAGPEAGLRDQVAEAANVLAWLGLVTAYGHVSARAGESMLITPAAHLAWGVTGACAFEVPLAASAPPGGTLPSGAPAEAWAHLASVPGPARRGRRLPGPSRPARSPWRRVNITGCGASSVIRSVNRAPRKSMSRSKTVSL